MANRPDVEKDTELQLKAVNDLAVRGQIDAVKALDMEREIKLNHIKRTAAYPGSKLPKGVSLTPKGDLGNSRGKEAKAAGGFGGAKIMDTKRYFR